MYERINHPGIIFPENQSPTPIPSRAKVAHRDLSKWGYETSEVSRITKSSRESIRKTLISNEIPYADGINKNKVRATYWEKKAVDTWLSTRPEVIENLPKGYMTTKEIAAALNRPERNIIKYLTSLDIAGTRVLLTVNGSKRVRLIFKKEAIETIHPSNSKQQ